MRRFVNCGAAHFLCCPPCFVLVALAVGCRPGDGCGCPVCPLLPLHVCACAGRRMALADHGCGE